MRPDLCRGQLGSGRPRSALSRICHPTHTLDRRGSELAALARLLRDPQCRSLTVVGPGEVGKTRLAIETASTRELFSDGVCFVPLVSLTFPQFILSAITDALSLMFSSSAESDLQLLNYLREKCLLLVLDSLEDLPETAELLVELLRQAPGCKLAPLVGGKSEPVMRLAVEVEHAIRGHRDSLFAGSSVGDDVC